MIFQIICILLIIYGVLHKYATRKFDYFKTRNIYNPKPTPFIGNVWDLITMKYAIGPWLKVLYENSPNVPYFGIFVFDEPHLILKCPDLIKQFLVKDFQCFTDRAIAEPTHSEIYSNVLFIQKNPNWKTVRSKLTPTFTSGKIKNLFPHMKQIADNLKIYMKKHCGDIEVKDVCFKYGIDVITKTFFGINAHCLDNDNAKFTKIAHDMFAFSVRNGLVWNLYFFKPELVNLFKLELFEKHITDFIKDAFWKTMESRKDQAVSNTNFVDILRDIRKNDKSFDGDKMIAQAIQFFSAGFDTIASTIAYTIYEVGLNLDIQEKLRREIKNTITKYKDLTYEAINDMRYLDMCIMETLRKYPVLSFLDRRCNIDYRIPETNTVIEKGTAIYIPLFGLHYDEKYFPNPEQYIPDRHIENVNAQKLIHFPFGYGPRACIGERMGLIGTKLGIISFINNFEVEKTKDTPVPIEFEPKSFLLQSKVGLPMRFREVVSFSG